MAALGGAGPAVRPAGRRADPGAARGALQQPARRQRRRPHLRGLRRHHRDHRPLPAERAARRCSSAASRRKPIPRPAAAMLLEAQNVTKAFGAFKAVDDALGLGRGGRDPRPDRAQRRRQVDLLQLPRPATCRRPRARVHFDGTDVTAPAARGARAARHRPHLPGAAHLRIDVGARQRHGRRLPAPSQRAATRAPRRAQVLERRRPRAARPTRRRRASARPAASGSRSPARSPPSPRRCCSTRRWPA